jgi:glycine dehydrogenase
MTGTLSEKLVALGFKQGNSNFFDTIKINLPENMLAEEIRDIALEHEINFRYFDINSIGISLDETTTIDDINHIVEVFAIAMVKKYLPISELTDKKWFDNKFARQSAFLELDLFNQCHSETEMMRYIKKLERKDISLTHSMIPLGSCTMKLNAAAELMPLSWTEFSGMHPFVPIDQSEGFHQLISELGKDLCEITGMSAISFEPNSGAAGEYAGLMVIRQYHIGNGNGHKNIALIPSSAHGTNPASAAMAGMQVVVVKCDENGNVDMDDLESKVRQHHENLSCCMITYPSTHGVFENGVKKIVGIIHANGGLVYMDGANMNAQVGLTSPGSIGVDVCHLNLHKTFAIPHGGGGPGMGPICVAEHLVEYLPTHTLVETGGINGTTAVSASPYGSASILIISYAYIKMLGGKGLTSATKYAILNANYLAACLKDYYKVLFTGEHGFVAHEMILDFRNFKPQADITETDVAKRLMDYGFHAPTLSFPVHGTLMIEPTESESLQELDRFVETLKQIHQDIQNIAGGKSDMNDNILKNAPHTMNDIVTEKWNHSYGREEAVFPCPWVRDNKYWPTVNRVDDAYGDRNFVCSCLPMESYRKEMK